MACVDSHVKCAVTDEAPVSCFSCCIARHNPACLTSYAIGKICGHWHVVATAVHILYHLELGLLPIQYAIFLLLHGFTTHLNDAINSTSC